MRQALPENRCAAAARAKSPRATSRAEGHGAYPADRKTFPIDKWNLASQRLRKHCSITTISVMTLFTQKGEHNHEHHAQHQDKAAHCGICCSPVHEPHI
jgi:hypothetical protein